MRNDWTLASEILSYWKPLRGTSGVSTNRRGTYQLQAAINAVHSDAPSAASTDWQQILELYDQLMSIAPSAVVALNRVETLKQHLLALKPV